MTIKRGLTYAKAGVSIDAGDELVRRIGPIANATRVPGVLAGVGGFSALFDLNSRGYRRPVLVSSTDGVGTKLKIAFMTGIHDTVGIDLVAMGVNDILTQGAAPLFFLDYFVCGTLNVAIAEAVVRGIAAGCRQAGCALIGGETAEHPGDFPKGEYDLAGFVVGVLEKKNIIDPAAIVPGDVLIGLPSSGLHSNGYSLARKVLLEVGQMKLSRHVPALGRTLGEELLKPTRIYANITRKLFDKHPIKGAAHITGGGIVGNLPRVLPIGRRAWIERSSWPVAPIFDLIQEVGHVAQAEMDRTFNSGLGMILVVDKKAADGVLGSLKRMNERGWVIGEIRRGIRGASVS
ncbi:MAG: phosphoribosylformylglycinamidine cyclo-ligase [Deltaproteobacteria bacterium]|nr:phosphoribosylformylglycinamidine cyclo-ligase [Deltaproteobacteria bacterium]MDZ4343203.1 phosphoribosylformylglycinamidine cyclo-ligase [Candidatus Binatia bacterium]